MASETVAPVDSVGAAVDTRGKHRILAELNRLEEELKFLEEELEELGKTEKVSTICKELLTNIQTTADPLLPQMHGPISPTWERWFEGPLDSSDCRCRIL